MKTKKAFASIISILCICALLCSCGEKVVSSVKKYVLPEKMPAAQSGTVAENERISMEWDSESSCVILYDKKNNKYYSTTPYDYYKSGETGSSYRESGLSSLLKVTYNNSEKNTLSEINSKENADYISAKKIDGGLRLVFYFDSSEISVPLLLTVTDDGISVTVETKGITEGKNKIISVSVLPFFASAGNNTDSYLFVPSGSGALMNVDDSKREARSYSEPVFGSDASEQPVYKTKHTQDIKLPVFGVKSGDGGMLGIITSGAESATVNAVAGDSQLGFSAVYPSFDLRGASVSYIKGTNGGSNEVWKYTKDISSTLKFTVKYVFLDNDANDYNAMAQKYREYLISENSLEKNGDAPDIMVNILGGAEKRELFLGIPYRTMTTLTTLDEAREILADIQKETDAGIAANLKGFGESGLDFGKLAGGFSPSNKLGGQEKLSSLGEWCKNAKIDLFYDYDLVFFNDSANGFKVRSAATSASDIRAMFYTYKLFNNQQDTDNQGAYLVDRYTLAVSDKKIADMASKLGVSGVGLSTLSRIAFSDNKSGNYYAKSHMSDDVNRIITALNSKNLKVFAESANLYAAVAADYVIDTPTVSSGYNSLDSDIPFYQMVFKGITSISGGVINLAQNDKAEYLRTVSTGCSLAFTLCDHVDSDILLGIHSATGMSVYNGVKSTMLNYIGQAKPLLESVRDSTIVSYSKNGDLSETVFDNGITVYINFGKTDLQTPLGTVNAESFIFG